MGKVVFPTFVLSSFHLVLSESNLGDFMGLLRTQGWSVCPGHFLASSFPQSDSVQPADTTGKLPTRCLRPCQPRGGGGECAGPAVPGFCVYVYEAGASIDLGICRDRQQGWEVRGYRVWVEVSNVLYPVPRG